MNTPNPFAPPKSPFEPSTSSPPFSTPRFNKWSPLNGGSFSPAQGAKGKKEEAKEGGKEEKASAGAGAGTEASSGAFLQVEERETANQLPLPRMFWGTANMPPPPTRHPFEPPGESPQGSIGSKRVFTRAQRCVLFFVIIFIHCI